VLHKWTLRTYMPTESRLETTCNYTRQSHWLADEAECFIFSRLYLVRLHLSYSVASVVICLYGMYCG